jgi:hypothetical protein
MNWIRVHVLDYALYSIETRGPDSKTSWPTPNGHIMMSSVPRIGDLIDLALHSTLDVQRGIWRVNDIVYRMFVDALGYEPVMILRRVGKT